MLGDHILHQYIAADSGHRSQISACLDLVGDDGVGAALQGADTADLHGIGTGAVDPGTHGIQEVGQVHDMGFLGSVFNNSLAGH